MQVYNIAAGNVANDPMLKDWKDVESCQPLILGRGTCLQLGLGMVQKELR